MRVAMARLAFRIINVFTDEPFGGNPMAVFDDVGELGGAVMQRIAQQMNLSESTFVGPTTNPSCDVRVRIFTPRMEVPMAGHPTVGTAFALGRERMVFEEGVSPIEVVRQEIGGQIRYRMTFGWLRWRHRAPPRRLVDARVAAEL